MSEQTHIYGYTNIYTHYQSLCGRLHFRLARDSNGYEERLPAASPSPMWWSGTYYKQLEDWPWDYWHQRLPLRLCMKSKPRTQFRATTLPQIN
ncbi:hypothetical protein KIN20_003671 [Parelaphostrongylus tenuis]|uniref:Uncharacterized protein n=1 Tax=Parelaphostrongylus tenuis TaxID=148309 RepID=A0AAD5LZI5_PARTN|nr:hypothetical protein KIN20_003671 [Parelaphostrongylus tenuis]